MSIFSRTAHIFSLARAKGSGTLDFPGHVTYHLDPYDENNLRKGLEKLLRIMIVVGLEEFGTHHCSGEGLNLRTSSLHEIENFMEHVISRSLRVINSLVLCTSYR